MVSPDNTKINYVPSDDGENPNDEPQISPVKSITQSAKDFKKVLGKEGKGEKSKDASAIAKRKTPVKMFTETEGEEETQSPELMLKPSKDDEEDAAQMAAVSLFDLSKQGQSKVKDAPSPVKEVANVESPSDLFKRMSSKPVKKEAQAPIAKQPVEKPKTEHFTARYAQEQPDLSYVNPMAAIQQPAPVAAAPTAKVESPKEIDSSLQMLIEQVIKHMYTVEKDGKTDTVMTLQYPPLFKDAKIIVSAYDTAKGQFNVSFENLTQAAQKILDMDENRKSLQAALEHKGYNIQIVTTTTIQTQNIVVAEPNPRESRDDQQGESRQQQRRQQK